MIRPLRTDLAVKTDMAIPKILHYCWFGGGECPKISKKCFKSWAKYFKDYRIIRWDESNFDCKCIPYVEQAYNAKKFMYVSDYARLCALYEYGGIYFDVDCKVLKSFAPLMDDYAFTGYGGDNREIASCTLAFEKKDPFIKECIDSYQNESFICSDGEYNTLSINQRMTNILISHGFEPNGKEQTVCNVKIYPMTYFCPLSMLPDTVKDCKSKDTYSMTIWTNEELLRERSLPVRIAHKTGLNLVKRKILEVIKK